MATSAEPLEGLHCTVPTTCKSPYTFLHLSQKNFTTKSIYKFAKFYLAWENSQHFATVVRGVGGGGGSCSPLVSLGSDIWEMNAEIQKLIPYQWLMHHYPDLGSASYWLCSLGIFLQLVRSAAQIFISMEFLRSSFRHPLNCPFCFRF